MGGNDSTLQYCSDRIDLLKAEYESAKRNTSYLKDELDSTWEALRSLRDEYHYYKEQADSEFQEASYCWENHDGANAKAHSENGHILNDRKSMVSSALDSANVEHDDAKRRFKESVSYQRSIKADLDEAKMAHKTRSEELKEQRLQESLHWHDKSCARCGCSIRYNDEWVHIPNYCKECREAFEIERKEKEEKRVAKKLEREAKWKEKPCKECGSSIRYNIEWSHPPNYCNDCKERFKRQKDEKQFKGSNEYKLRFKPQEGRNDFLFGNNKPNKGDGHGHVVVDGDGQVHYVRDTYNPQKPGDRKDAESFDDGVFL